MFRGTRSRARIALTCTLSALAPLLIGTGSLAAMSGGAASPRATSPTFVGPLVSHAETTEISWGRDGGISVPLPNGNDFWIFGDTPRYSYQSGKWKLTAFIEGSSAGVIPYKLGHPPAGQYNEVVPRRKNSPTNKPTQFLPSPHLYMPDGSGRTCNKANGGQSAAADRWATGAALMPDKTNILISYMGVCVISASNFRSESWGFAEFNTKTNRFTVPPTDVFPANHNGAGLPLNKFWQSPIIANGKVTYFVPTCCASSTGVYTATMALNVATMKKQGSYAPHKIPGLGGSPLINVAPPSNTQKHLTMYQMSGYKGQYQLFKAPSAAGPWSKIATGSLPRCNTSPSMCISVALHPELSTSSRMLVSYYLPGYGPGIAKKHPYPHPPLNHVVMAYLPD